MKSRRNIFYFYCEWEQKENSKRLFVCGFIGRTWSISGKSEKDQKKFRNQSAKSCLRKKVPKNFSIFAYQVEPLCERKCDNFPLANVYHRQPCERRKKIEKRQKCHKKISFEWLKRKNFIVICDEKKNII